MIDPIQAAKLLNLYERSVKAHQRWEAANPGTQTKRVLADRADQADLKFKAFIFRITRN